MTATIVSSIIAGSRIQAVSEGYEFSVERTTERIDPSQFEAKTVIKPTLLIGDRITAYEPLLAAVSIGTLASSVSVSGDPRYVKIDIMPLGKRISFEGKDAYFSEIEMSQDVTKTYTGISTHGLGYVPSTDGTQNNTELRRWPRNWYGDNIKK